MFSKMVEGAWPNMKRMSEKLEMIISAIANKQDVTPFIYTKPTKNKKENNPSPSNGCNSRKHLPGISLESREYLPQKIELTNVLVLN
jgi:hypothetical protein